MAAVVTLQLNGEPPDRKFRLYGGKLMMQTVRDTFKLDVVEFNGVVADTDAQGLSYEVFEGGATITVTGNSLGGHTTSGRAML